MSLALTGAGKGKGGNLLAEASWFVNSTDYDSANTRLNDLSGNGLHAVFGSGTNAPQYLPYEGTKYVYFTGAAEDFQTPDTAALDITGDILLIARIACDITPSAVTNIVSKLDSGTTGSYTLRLNTDGKLSSVWVDQTPASNSHTSSVTLGSVGIVDNQKVWIAWSLDVDNGASGSDSRFYYGTTDTNDYAQVTWTQLGTTSAGAVTNIQVSVEALQIGARKDNSPAAMLTGRVYWAGVFNALLPSSGTLVAEFNPNTGTIATNHTTITNGSTVWTRTLAATGKHAAIVDESKCVLGTDDYLEVSDNALLNFSTTDDFTIVVVYRSHDVSDEYYPLIKISSALLEGWIIASFGGTPLGTTYDGGLTSAGVGPTVTDGQRQVAVYRRMAGVEMSHWINGTEGAVNVTNTSYSATNSDPVRVGALSAGTILYTDLEFVAGAVFRRALTDAEITRISSGFAL